ncbi:hypothetical protein HYH02_011484 [Chlamydomonas schloesseri]|uniref:Uncharacterized protein n=1 Tax=Chlamydomonas schloesseri TaxID=2026947 RepID=A0A835T3W3_9CHLO|nr:hypothetical protein HYH02_011484 [Chlamydomonas schloesseri]|eukprot:KAG2436547.1 hypothetical protein HYH02_011484 [Chlamydomonas schloesseri]
MQLSQAPSRGCGARRVRPFTSRMPARVCIRAQAGEGGPSTQPQPTPAAGTPAARPAAAAAPGPRPAGAPRPMPPGARPGAPGPRPGPGGPARPGVMLGPDGQPLEVVPVEKTGDDAWAGVARVDRGSTDAFDLQSALVLAAGDAAALLLFAAAGRSNHGEATQAVDALGTALPFIIGWFATAPFLGGFGAEARKKGVPAAAATAAKCWAAGVPLGLVIRGLSRGYVPPVPFIGVSMAVTGVLLVGWRSALAAATKPDEPDSLKARKDKRGNPFEFLELLMSLTKRW